VLELKSAGGNKPFTENGRVRVSFGGLMARARSHDPSPRFLLAARLLFTACVVAETSACNGGTASDSSDAGPSDGADRHDGESGDGPTMDLGPHDAGSADAGLCACSYGFHQECGQGEVCQAAYDQPAFAGATMCVPSGPPPAPTGCNLTSSPYDDRNFAPCSAQCVSALRGSPCGAVADRAPVGADFMDWFGAMANAADPAKDNNFPANGDFTRARAPAPDPPADCREFLGWTALGLYAFCVGDDAIVENRSGWNPIDGWVFKPIPTTTSTSTDPKYCRSNAGGLCAAIISGGANAGGTLGEQSADAINMVSQYCPGGFPFSAPCNGPDALTCAHDHLVTIIRAINTPLQ
jgi:hypothetical protein